MPVIEVDVTNAVPELNELQTVDNLNGDEVCIYIVDDQFMADNQVSHSTLLPNNEEGTQNSDSQSEANLVNLLVKEIHNMQHPFKCHICGEGFTYIIPKRIHMKEKHGDSSGTFPCEECGKVYYAKYQLKLHADRAHSDVRNFVCNTCGSRFIRQYELKGHMKKHEGEAILTTIESPVQINILNPVTEPDGLQTVTSLSDYIICDFIQEDTDNLVFQDQSNNDSVHAYVQFSEEYESANIDLVKPQKKKKHPYRCHICGQGFPFVKPKKSHMQEVHGIVEKIFPCDECAKVYSTSYQLKLHVDRVHLNIGTFACDFCESSFSRQNDLLRHMKKHKDLYLTK